MAFASTDSLIDQLAGASSLPPCTALVGDEMLLANELAEAVRAAAERLGSTQRSHFVLDARSDWAAVANACQSSTLFDSLRLIEISLPGGKPGRTGAQALQNLLALAHSGELPDVRLLVRLPTLDRTTRQSKWAKALHAQAHWIDVPTIARAELPRWIAGRLARQSQQADAATLQWLADKVEGNLLAAHQEIQKLGLLYPAGELDAHAVQAAVLDVARYDPFELRDAVLGGHAPHALKILDGLHAEGQPQTLIVWILGEDIRLMLRLAQSAPSEHAAVLRAQRVFGNRQALVREALARAPRGLWAHALRHVQEIDALIKGIDVPGRLSDAWAELARLVARIAGATAAPGPSSRSAP